MNVKGIFVIVVIVSIVAMTLLLPNNLRNMPPVIMDDIEPNDEYSLEIGSKTLSPNEISVIENQTTSFYYKNGTKHYVIKATDEVTIED